MRIDTDASKIFFTGKMVAEYPREFEFVSDVAYEVIRAIDGKPLFYQGHMDRLKESLFSIMEKDNVYFENCWERISCKVVEGIQESIIANHIVNQNIKVLVGETSHEGWEVIVFPIRSYYPEPHVYAIGVDTMILNEVRHHPNIKAVNESLTEHVTRLREETGIYEAILLTSEGYVAEGSRSNLFFVKGNTLVTAPDAMVLKGITRQMVIDTAKGLGIDLEQREIRPLDIVEFDGAFLTGTSIHILPIRSIGDWHPDSANNPLVERLTEAFENTVRESLRR